MTTRRELIHALATNPAPVLEIASRCETTEAVALAFLKRLPELVRIETPAGAKHGVVSLLVPFDELLLAAEAVLDLGALLPPK